MPEKLKMYEKEETSSWQKRNYLPKKWRWNSLSSFKTIARRKHTFAGEAREWKGRTIRQGKRNWIQRNCFWRIKKAPKVS